MLRYFPRRSLHVSRTLNWKLRDEYKLTRPELQDRISNLLVLQRYDALDKLKLSFEFSDQLLNTILRKLKLNPVACLSFFKLASKQQKFRPNLKSYCIIVHILSRARMYDQTRAYLNELVGLCNNNYSASVVWDELVRVYREFTFSPTVFDMILKVFAEKGMTKYALHVFDNMGKCGRSPSLRSCNSLLSNLVRNGQSHTALLVYEQIIRFGIVPDVYTCSIMVTAYCKEGRLSRALEFVKEMESSGCELNVVTYNSLIDGYVSVGDVKGAQLVLGLMSERGIMRNVVSYTLLIKGYCKQCKMEEAEKVLRGMKVEEESGVVDERAYGVLLDGYCKASRMDDAIRIQDEMLSTGLNMNIFICNSLINGYCKVGQVREAEGVCLRMRYWNLKPDSYSYNTLMDGYCRKGQTSEALKLFHDMLQEGINHTVVTYNTLLKGLCQAVLLMMLCIFGI
ncbi:putative pentatricopeptide repeat-containing protein [Prunus yedoensis var. nudiflora]|uniref:Putative pentatricopeptide repeat-containing protein n=1 Tax=Prunus yedoensis var. nudiflora TaxID=2094558 RepID=A0A314ZQU6_PRUYE|nr:putative pentatricopeptide repeat-containing protein [Prunus yedoensis var. nudiflora]